MTQQAKPELHVPTNPVRIVTASSLFDGHDASINIMRRIMQSQGAEVIHLGHNRSVQEVVDAAIEEDAQGVAVSSYQGGHVEYFEYLVELLWRGWRAARQGRRGGGGVIVADEIERLKKSGVHIFSPEDGQKLGLVGMINQVVADCDFDVTAVKGVDVHGVLAGDRSAVREPSRRLSSAAHRRGPGRVHRCSGHSFHARPGHHRHWWLGQVLAHR